MEICDNTEIRMKHKIRMQEVRKNPDYRIPEKCKDNLRRKKRREDVYYRRKENEEQKNRKRETRKKSEYFDTEKNTDLKRQNNSVRTIFVKIKSKSKIPFLMRMLKKILNLRSPNKKRIGNVCNESVKT